MQQRQPRLGDILDDYCPRERRLTNHAVVAMIGDAVKQTRCTTCEAEHEYKHAKVPRQRRKADTPPALYAQVAAGAPKRVPHDEADGGNGHDVDEPMIDSEEQQDPQQPADDPHAADVQHAADATVEALEPADDVEDDEVAASDREEEEGPVH